VAAVLSVDILQVPWTTCFLCAGLIFKCIRFKVLETICAEHDFRLGWAWKTFMWHRIDASVFWALFFQVSLFLLFRYYDHFIRFFTSSSFLKWCLVFFCLLFVVGVLVIGTFVVLSDLCNLKFQSRVLVVSPFPETKMSTTKIRVNKIWHGFVVALDIDEKLLVVESHSLMLVNLQKGNSPSNFLRNPTYGGISTSDRLLRKPQNYRWRKKFFGILSLNKMGMLDSVFFVRCATGQLRSTTRQFAQCHLLLAHFQHCNLIYIELLAHLGRHAK